MGNCHEKKYRKYRQFVLNNAVCLCHTDELGFHDILDDVPQKNEHSTQPDHSDAQHDPLQAASKIQKGNQTIHHLDHQGGQQKKTLIRMN